MLLYRVVKQSPPTVRDFMSNTSIGKPPPPNDAEAARLWDGISTFDTAAQAMRQARTYSLGTFVAELDIPQDIGNPARVEKTRGPGHHTVWGDPETMLKFVKETQPIPPPVIRLSQGE